MSPDNKNAHRVAKCRAKRHRVELLLKPDRFVHSAYDGSLTIARPGGHEGRKRKEIKSMKQKTYNRYSYKELLAAATGKSATQTDIDTLGAWFSEFGSEYWNGEYYDADGARLFQIYKEDEDGEFEVIGYEFR